jgi:hypothetical protein
MKNRFARIASCNIEIFGADAWQYDSDNQYLLIKGIGSKLTIRIQKLVAQQSPVSLQSCNQN